ncbi:tRNA dimethylallyltransferase [Paraliobacillus sp. PM-2]|uniref:tRNA (adenosine(37)-N6)-dimethylallyltransferase MiaA n=1 Tax=Paraliobacillus sp. PM-2 TaxID=1462524 RepID=UPI00061BEE40|nr:tRNA (adenosine(37)-N6)-dimethylallyltransferase MiaA [Paraliobacillus sp. PM-2]CQR47614.1 tRNA dimethylallyltransferase [Paraliobacillus sp. PM-2]
MKEKVIAVVGPTAVGKTSLSVEIAKYFDGEIISGDSMQIYQGMDIGTAKITKEEQQSIKHYMLDIISPEQSFSVADFQQMVQKHINEISNVGKLPIIAGGTGLYIQAALYNYQFVDNKRDDFFQKKLEQEVELKGADHLYQRLKQVDPMQAQKIHPNNIRRVIRSLEVFERTGMSMSEHHANQSLTSPYEPILIGLEMDRELLYNRINYRVDQMMENGLLEEVSHLYNQGLENSQAMQAIGYKEFIPYLKGEQSIERSIELLKRNSRRYAKRQYTWFKNKMDVMWYTISPNDKNKKFSTILKDLAGMINHK